MARTPQYMLRVASWEQTLGAFIANASDFERFDPERVRLEQITNRFKVLINQRAAYAASKQETTREMQDLFQEAETLVDHMCTTVRNFYGVSSEKLVEFGMTPTSSRSRRTKRPAEPEAPEAPAMSEPSAAPHTEK